jgi:hypothetical protein
MLARLHIDTSKREASVRKGTRDSAGSIERSSTGCNQVPFVATARRSLADAVGEFRPKSPRPSRIWVPQSAMPMIERISDVSA